MLRITEKKMSISTQEEGENWAKVTVLLKIFSFSSVFMSSLEKERYELGLKLVSKNRRSSYSIKVLFFIKLELHPNSCLVLLE